MVPAVIFFTVLYYIIFDVYKENCKALDFAEDWFWLCVSVQVCVCGGASQGITRGRIYP